jgi:membrane dipeptidase
LKGQCPFSYVTFSIAAQFEKMNTWLHDTIQSEDSFIVIWDLQIVGCLLSFALVTGCAQQQQETPAGLHEQALVFDAHAHSNLRLLKDKSDFGTRSEKGHIDLPRIREGGVDALVFAAWSNPKDGPDKGIQDVLRMADVLHQQLEKFPDRLELALTATDIRRISAAGKTAAIFAVEGGHLIGNDAGILRMYYRLGMRIMTLVWTNNHEWADGCGSNTGKYGYYKQFADHGGLSEKGRDIVREMNRLGIVIDVSHAAAATFDDVLATSAHPVIASHSCADALRPHERNLTDIQLRALAESGGVVGVNFSPFYLALKDSVVTVRTIVDHIDHMVQVMGVNHVGLGSDFDAISTTPEDLTDYADMPKITEELVRRGYDSDAIEKILGGNLLRVFEIVTGS